MGHAKGKSKAADAAPADQSAADANAAAADPNAAPADQSAAPADQSAADQSAAPAEQPPAPGTETVTPEGGEEQLPLEPQKAKAPTTLSWQDIVVVPRKAFLKALRLEVQPMVGMSVNDNLIRHYGFGGALNFYLSDALSIGLEGQYYVKELSDTEENVGLQYNRLPTVNRYKYSGAFMMGYAPAYGKFALFNKQIMHWEIFVNGGVGAIATEIIPRDPGLSAFSNTDIMVAVGVGTRFFLFNWLTVNFMLRDYMFNDVFEPVDREGNPALKDPAAAKMEGQNTNSAFVQNFMVYAGIGIYLPTKFSYKTPR